MIWMFFIPTEEDVLLILKSKTSNGQAITRDSQNFSNKNKTIIASNYVL